MKPFELEERWFCNLIKHFQECFAIPIVTSAYPISEAPCIYLEKNLSAFAFNGWSIELIFHIFLDYEGDGPEAVWMQKIRQLLELSLEFQADAFMPASIAHFKETKMMRKNADKKVRQLTLVYQGLVQLKKL